MAPERLQRAALLIAALLVSGRVATAHEMGSMKVEATFGRQGDYRIGAMVLPDHLPDDLNPFTGLDDESLDTIEERIVRFRAKFVESARVEFDGEPVLLDAAPQEAPVGRIGILLTGPVPRGAQTMTWSTSLPTA